MSLSAKVSGGSTRTLCECNDAEFCYFNRLTVTAVKQTYEATLDSHLLVLSADINQEKARKMRVEHGLFDVDAYIARLVTVMGGRDGQQQESSQDSPQRLDWTRMGQMAAGYMRRAPAVDFM